MAEPIEAYCFTNLDEYKREKWPDKFVALPRIGDRVQAESGRVLKIVSITHAMRKQTTNEGTNHCMFVMVPYLRVELHRPWTNGGKNG